MKGIFDIHVIDVYLTNARGSAWVFDTGSVAHICNSKQGLPIKRRLSKDEVTMRVGNGSKVDVITGTVPLHLPSGLVLDMNNCYESFGVKLMKKLHADGLFESLDYESFDACEPCLMGNMTRSPEQWSEQLTYWK